MSKLYFITDLDRTIIHSKNKGFKCVEVMGKKEITYMTEDGYKSLMGLLKNDKFEFVPCTMRNIKQTLRVDFIREYDPRRIICSNGAQIYIDGKLDEEWNKYMRSLIDVDDVINQIRYLEELRRHLINYSYIEEIRNIEDFYITVKAKTIEDATIFYDVIKDKFPDYLDIIQIERKIFIINTMINKVFAVDYIVKKYNIGNYVTSGDSIVDKEFTQRGISILPKHSSFKHTDSIITEKEGIYSSEDIFNYLNKKLEDIS